MADVDESYPVSEFLSDDRSQIHQLHMINKNPNVDILTGEQRLDTMQCRANQAATEEITHRHGATEQQHLQ